MDTRRIVGSLAALLLAAPLSAADWAAIRGVNYFSSPASSAHDMWLRLDVATVERELRWASGLGFNSIRLWLSYPAFQASQGRFEKDLDAVFRIAARHRLSVMPVLFDHCGISPRPDGVEMTVNQAYHHFLSNPSRPAPEKERIRKTYREFAEGRGKEMLIRVGKSTPPDIIFWQHWSPNPGLERMGRGHWPSLEKYADAVLAVSSRHANVLAIDVINEPGVIFDLPAGMTRSDAEAVTASFLAHFTGYLRKRHPKAVLTIGSENLERMKLTARHVDVLSIHSYRLGNALDELLRQAAEFGRSQAKPVLLTECLANTNNWLDVRHGEESRSSDEAQLRHYQDTLPRILKSGLGWYSWGFIAGHLFTPFTDILYPNGYRRPAAVYLESQIKGKK